MSALNMTAEAAFRDEAEAHQVRRAMIQQGKAVSLIAYDSARGEYVFDHS
jgi:hypothetical protein